MKIIITMILSASFLAASSGTTAEEGLMKAIGKIDKTPKPLIAVKVVKLTDPTQHIRELHGDLPRFHVVGAAVSKRNLRLAKFKAKLKKQKEQRRSGLTSAKVRQTH